MKEHAEGLILGHKISKLGVKLMSVMTNQIGLVFIFGNVMPMRWSP